MISFFFLQNLFFFLTSFIHCLVYFSFSFSLSLVLFPHFFIQWPLIHWPLLMNRKYDEDVRLFILFICIPQVMVKFQMHITLFYIQKKGEENRHSFSEEEKIFQKSFNANSHSLLLCHTCSMLNAHASLFDAFLLFPFIHWANFITI